MPEMPEKFDSEQELVDWFENADLGQYPLERALDIIVGTRVSLSVDDPPQSLGARRARIATADRQEPLCPRSRRSACATERRW